MDEKEFIKGFNRGYTLKRHSEELAGKIADALKASEKEIDQGFLAGAKEYELERLEKFTARPLNYQLQEKRKGDLDKGLSDRSRDNEPQRD